MRDRDTIDAALATTGRGAAVDPRVGRRAVEPQIDALLDGRLSHRREPVYRYAPSGRGHSVSAISSVPTRSVFLRLPGVYATRGAGQGGDRPEGCFTSEDDRHEVASSPQKSGMPTSWGHRLFLLR